MTKTLKTRLRITCALWILNGCSSEGGQSTNGDAATVECAPPGEYRAIFETISSECGAGGAVEVPLTLTPTRALFGEECSGTVEPSGACGWAFDIECPSPDNSTTLVGTMEARASGPSGEFEGTLVGFDGTSCTTRTRLVGLVPIDR